MQVMIYAVSAMLSFAVLTVGLRRLDPNRARDKQVRVHVQIQVDIHSTFTPGTFL